MALRYILLITAAFGIADVSAQVHSVNELYALHKQYKKNVRSDSVAVNQLLKIAAWHYEASLKKAYPRSKDSLLYYGAKVINLSRATGFHIGEGKVLLLYAKNDVENRNTEKARKHSKQALEIFQKEDYKPGMAEAYLSLAKLYDPSPDKTSFELAQKAKEIYKASGNKVQEGVVMGTIGYMYLRQGDYDNAFSSFNDGLQLFTKARYQNERVLESLLGIADALYNQGKLNESLKYRIEAAQLAEELDPLSFITARCFNSLGKLYHASGEIEKALAYFKKAYVITDNYVDEDLLVVVAGNLAKLLVELERPKEGLFYLKVLENKSNLPEWAKIMVVSRCLFIYSYLKNYADAKTYAIKAELIIKNEPEGRSLVSLYAPLAKYYYETQQYDISRKYLEKYKAYAIKNSISVDFEYIHRQLFKIDSVQNAFASAINNLSLSYQYRDSVLDKDTKNRLSELNVKYDVFKKDRDLELKNKDNKLLVKQNELQNERLSFMNFTRNASIIGLIALVIVIALLYSRAKANKKNNRILQANQAEITNSYEAMKLLVVEKEWLLKEIHHRVKNNLHIIMSLLKSQSYFLEDQAALTAIRNSQHRIQSMSLIHQKLYMSDSLTAIRMPEYVTELVEYLAESFSSHKDVQFHLQIEDVEMDVSQGVPLGLILNEAITNCFKYAFPQQKGNIRVVLENTVHDTFCLKISDDGVGISPDLDITKTKSLGMKLIKGLTEDLEGELQIDSNKGTSIKVEFVYKPLLWSN